MRFCIWAVRPVTAPHGTPDSVCDSFQSPDICTIGRSDTSGWSRKAVRPHMFQPRL